MRFRFERLSRMFLIVAGVIAISTRGSDGAPRTSFSYQGQIKRNGVPLTDTCEMRFTLFNAPAGDSSVGTPNILPVVSVANGLFSVDLDFGVCTLKARKHQWLTGLRVHMQFLRFRYRWACVAIHATTSRELAIFGFVFGIN